MAGRPRTGGGGTPAHRRWWVTLYPRAMPFTVLRYEDTPNPNAMKCWLDRPITPTGGPPKSFLNAAAAIDDPVARALFDEAGATTVLFFGAWITVNKPAGTPWSTMKRKIERVLGAARTEPTASGSPSA